MQELSHDMFNLWWQCHLIRLSGPRRDYWLIRSTRRLAPTHDCANHFAPPGPIHGTHKSNTCAPVFTNPTLKALIMHVCMRTRRKILRLAASLAVWHVIHQDFRKRHGRLGIVKVVQDVQDVLSSLVRFQG